MEHSKILRDLSLNSQILNKAIVEMRTGLQANCEKMFERLLSVIEQQQEQINNLATRIETLELN